MFPRIEVTYIVLQSSIFFVRARARARASSQEILRSRTKAMGLLDRASRRDRSPLFFNNNCSGIVDRCVIRGGWGAIAWARSRVIARIVDVLGNHLRRNTNRVDVDGYRSSGSGLFQSAAFFLIVQTPVYDVDRYLRSARLPLLTTKSRYAGEKKHIIDVRIPFPLPLRRSEAPVDS